MRWILQNIFYCHVFLTFAYKPSMNQKNKNMFCRSKLDIENRTKSIMVLTKIKKKVRPILNSLFPGLFAKRNVKI